MLTPQGPFSGSLSSYPFFAPQAPSTFFADSHAFLLILRASLVRVGWSQPLGSPFLPNVPWAFGQSRCENSVRRPVAPRQMDSIHLTLVPSPPTDPVVPLRGRQFLAERAIPST